MTVRAAAAGALPFAPAALVGAILAWWEGAGGGFEPSDWYIGALFLLLLTAVVVAARPDLVRALDRHLRLAAACLLGYAAWSATALVWAQDRGEAWDGANRTFLYATVFFLGVLLPWTGRAALAALGVIAAVPTFIGAATLDRAATATDPHRFFIGGRLASPMGYPNANAALFLAALWVALGLSARRSLPWTVRCGLLACAGGLESLALMCQSRGAALTFPFVAAIFFAISHDRLRSLVALLLSAGVTALNSRAILDVFSATSGGEADPHRTLVRAQHSFALTLGELLALGALWALVDSRVRIPARVTRWIGRLVLALVLLGVVGGAVAAVSLGGPRGRIHHAWEQFRHNQKPLDHAGHFSSGLGSNRYDFWRVGLGEFTRHPLAGVGTDNFAIDYVERRKSDEEPLYPHSLEVRVLAQTGLVGAALLGAFLALAVLAGLRAHRATDPTVAAAAPLALMPFVDWLVHGSADWFWEFPALTGVALFALAIAARLGRPGWTAGPRRSRATRPTLAVAAALAVGALCVSYALPLLAVRNNATASRIWRADPAGARDRLASARRLNRLSEQPDLYASAIASRLHDWAWARAALEDGIARNERDWYLHFELALVDSTVGRRAAARQELLRAQQLNPREPLVRQALRELGAGKRLSVQKFDRLIIERNVALSR